MENSNYKKYQELLDKWKNFSKVYDAIHEAYHLGYVDGSETQKYCNEMAAAETMDISNISIDKLTTKNYE